MSWKSRSTFFVLCQLCRLYEWPSWCCDPEIFLSLWCCWMPGKFHFLESIIRVSGFHHFRSGLIQISPRSAAYYIFRTLDDRSSWRHLTDDLLESSAQFNMLLWLLKSVMPLMYLIRSSGHNTVTCGIPILILDRLHFSLKTTTSWILPFRSTQSTVVTFQRL